MLKLLKHLKNYKKECILSPLFKLTEAVFELIVPLIVASIINVGIGNGDTAYILKMCALLALFAVLGLACALAAQFFAAKAAVGLATDVRHALFEHISRLSFSQVDRLGSSTLITRLTGDVLQVQTGVNLTFRLILRSPIVVFGAVIMAFTVDAKTGAVFAVTVPVLAIVIFAIMLVCIPMYKKVQQRLDGVLHKTAENLAGTRVVRAFGKEDEETKDFDAKARALADMQIAVGKISVFLNPVTLVIINIAIVCLFYFGALRVEGCALSSGDVVAQYNYMSQILVELIKLASLIITVTKAVASGNRIQAVLDIQPEMVSGSIQQGKGCDTAVEFDGVSLSYGGADNSLTDINLKIKRGTTVGIIGSTGSGKSSLINLIPRFYDVTEGAVFVDGINVKDYDMSALRDKIGVVSQKKVLFKGTVRENIRFGKSNATDEEIWRALEISQAGQMVREKPGGLDFCLEQDGKNLSGGQRQRLTIARALVRKPEILILDDATSALDYATCAALNAALSHIDFETTVITVSQRISAIKSCDTVVVLDEGKIVGVGTAAALLESCDVYREIYESQPEGGRV